jgi:hypothetical protein
MKYNTDIMNAHDAFIHAPSALQLQIITIVNTILYVHHDINYMKFL